MNFHRLCIVLCAVVLFAGCVTVRGSGVAQKQNFVRTMQDLTLEKLYELAPRAQRQIADAAGYAVFSNVSSNLAVVSTGNGYGIVTDNTAQEQTYMKMFSLGLGVGLGAKDYRLVVIFKKQADLERFAEGRWDFSGQFDAVMKSDEKGGSITGVDKIGADIITYQFTEAGLALQATLQGAKFWRYEELNS